MFDSKEFGELVTAGNPSGEVIGVDRFLITIAGLDEVPLGALILFDNGDIGMIRTISDDHTIALNITGEELDIGTLAVLKSGELSVEAGDGVLGRVIDPLVRPIDGKGMIPTDTRRLIFNPAPSFTARGILNTQLETGVTIVDTLFPVVCGQRIAVLGDSKSGKTTFLTQVVMNQAKAGKIVVYVMVGKRHADVDLLLSRLEASNTRDRVVVVLADTFDSLAMAYLAPYAGCALAEYFWDKDQDVVIIYDDLSSHAKAYRELSLLLRVNPGRESYPGDMFYTHSSLLERAGKLASNSKTLTALPVAITPNDDITGYLSTSLISMTDGQIIFDMETMHKGIKPAVNVGLSVSRVGGRAQSLPHKQLSTKVSKKLSDYRRASEFAHFGSELAIEAQKDLAIGQRIYDVFGQTPEELFSLKEQQIMLLSILLSENIEQFSVPWIKSVIKDVAKSVDDESRYAEVAKQVIQSNPMVKQQ